MFQRIPASISVDSLRHALDEAGLAGRYDAVYVPTNRGVKSGSQTALVNFAYPEDAVRCMRVFSANRALGGAAVTVEYSYGQGAAFVIACAQKAAAGATRRHRRAKLGES